MPVALFVPEIVTGIIGGSALAGSIGSWCAQHHENKGCAKKKRDFLDTAGLPSLGQFLGRRQKVGPCNVPQYNFDMCHEQLQGITVQSSIPGAGAFKKEARFDNVPAACMNLAGVLSGDCTDATIRPTVCGSACLHYAGLTDADYAKISSALSS